MAKHTVKAINGRFKNGFFPGEKWRNDLYNWHRTPDRDAKMPLQIRENKRGMSMAGCGCHRTTCKEISATIGTTETRKTFKFQIDGFRFSVELNFHLWLKHPGFYWSASGRRNPLLRWPSGNPKHSCWEGEKVRATDTKKFADINEEDARRFLASVLMAPGFWLEYQIDNDLTRAQVIDIRRRNQTKHPHPFDSRGAFGCITRSIERARVKRAKVLNRFYPEVEALYWSDEDPEQFIFSL